MVTPGEEAGKYLDLSVVVVTYNSAERIVETIEAHERTLSHLEMEILVVDNASSDDTVRLAHGAFRHGQVIANTENLGYGKAVNLALRSARGTYVLILNDDARLEDGAVDSLIGALQSSRRIALAGPRILDEQGEPMPAARMTFPGLREEILRLMSRVNSRNPNQQYPTGSGVIDVSWLVGACLLAKTDLLRQVGGFNDAFFLYGEDIDLGRRLHALGYRSVTVPGAICIHVGAASTGNRWSVAARVHRRMSARDLYYRIWVSRPERVLLNLRRAIGLKNQPSRLRFFLPRVLYDGPSLQRLKFPASLASNLPDTQTD